VTAVEGKELICGTSLTMKVLVINEQLSDTNTHTMLVKSTFLSAVSSFRNPQDASNLKENISKQKASLESSRLMGMAQSAVFEVVAADIDKKKVKFGDNEQI